MNKVYESHGLSTKTREVGFVRAIYFVVVFVVQINGRQLSHNLHYTCAIPFMGFSGADISVTCSNKWYWMGQHASQVLEFYGKNMTICDAVSLPLSGQLSIQ
jgi:hypothetical protein